MIQRFVAAALMLTMTAALPAAEPDAQLAHNVYFKVKDGSPDAAKKLVGLCKKYLQAHEGVVFFAAGTLAADLDRPVNDRDFDVALHMVFKNKASHDKYQDAPAHLQFIAEGKEIWAKVRVFDSYVGQ